VLDTISISLRIFASGIASLVLRIFSGILSGISFFENFFKKFFFAFWALSSLENLSVSSRARRIFMSLGLSPLEIAFFRADISSKGFKLRDQTT